MAQTDKLTQAVLRQHPLYRKMQPVYQFYEESYKGGNDYVSSANLHMHTFEDKDSFEERKARAYYYNYSAPIVNAYNSFIYRQEIKREFGDLEGNPLFEQFLQDANKQGKSYSETIRDVSKWSSVSGIRFVLVDKPSETGDTAKDEQERGLFPYIVHIDPQNVLDWGLDKFGNLLWVKVREVVGDAEEFDDDPDKLEQFRIWYADRWELYEVTRDDKGAVAVKIDDGEHPVGEVPIVPVCHFSEDPIQGQSLLNDIAYVNRALFNWCSLLDEILYRQTFSQLVMPEDPKNPLSDTALGTAKGIGFPPDSSHPPHFISPDATQATVLMNQIEKGVEEIYRLATLRGAIGVTEQSSGVARSYDFMITNNTLSSKALNMEDAEMRILRIWAKWQQIEEPGHSVEYPREFEISSLQEEMNNILMAKTLEVSDRFEQILKERLVKRMLPREDQADIEQIENEIKAPKPTQNPERTNELTNRVNDILGTNGEGGEQRQTRTAQ